MIKMIQKLKNKKGFTLVELIVVIAIIAILTAVIVPLIARYSAQAQYTTLQDAAQTISNSANNALSDGNQVSALNVKEIHGWKTGNQLTIKVIGSTTGGASVTSTTDGDLGSGATAVKATGGNDGENRAAERLCLSLATTLPDDCAFFAKINQSAVAGVIYSTSVKAEVTAASTDIAEVEGFDNAYEGTFGGVKGALGVSGTYIKKTTTPATPTT